MRSCPYCGREIDDKTWAEVARTTDAHRDVGNARLRPIGEDPLPELDERLEAAITRLQCEVAALSIFLPDLSERQKRLIDNVVSTVHDWEATR